MLWPFLCGMIYLLLTVPVIGDLVLDISDAHRGVRLSLRAWGMSLRIEDKPLKPGINRQSVGSRTKRLKKNWPMLRAALRTIRWGQTDIRMRVGLGEAAQTAMIAGSVHAGVSALRAIVGQRFPIEAHIKPDFRAPCFVLVARCIFSMVPGDIIFAVLLAAVKKTGREGFRWRSIRLKA